uniref:U3 small nucleolar RNA-associated protein 13 C-terminal domain-containing protein n=2 Tax=Odontella aurita TaxID=265563 RepID=A0A7S4J2X7_9STRA|mmetsp:Transcript_3650/g.9835  ORF Transcript_3650/g.9835 Transcript_3650/m.9835 type:complete len:190 (+) Transcript_3650:378-947(+)
MLRYCRDWNTRARNSSIATLVVRAVVSSVPVPTLADAEGGALPEVLAGVVPYAERHFDRLDRMYGETYLIDHCLTGMGCLDAPMGMDGADGEGQGEYDRWSAKSKPVLPPTSADGRVQVGGMDMVGLSAADTKKKRRAGIDSDDSSDSEDEGDDDSDVVTIGDSDTESESEHGAGGSDSEGDGSSGERD